MSKKIAIVGAGISGMGAAWMLQSSGFDVTVYEAGKAPGGQMETFEVESQGEKLQFDNYVACLAVSHNMRALGELLGIQAQEYDYGVYIAHGKESWGNYVHTDFLKNHQEECDRFVSLMQDLYQRDASIEAASVTMGDFLENHQFSPEFAQYILSILMEALVDCDLLPFTVANFVEIFAAGLFSFFDMPKMYRFKNGILEPVQKLAALLEGRIKLNCGVVRVTRKEESVEVLDVTGAVNTYDEIIFSSNFQLNRRMISDLTQMEQNIFNGIEYRELQILVHSDPSALQAPDPLDPRLVCAVGETTVSNPVFTHGHSGNKRTDYLISALKDGHPNPIPETAVHFERRYTLERITINSLIAKGHIHYIQGANRSWYCGLSTVPGLSECCLVSGLVIAEKLGARYPFGHLPKAQRVFDNIKKQMFGGEPSLKMFF